MMQASYRNKYNNRKQSAMKLANQPTPLPRLRRDQNPRIVSQCIRVKNASHVNVGRI